MKKECKSCLVFRHEDCDVVGCSCYDADLKRLREEIESSTHPKLVEALTDGQRIEEKK